MGYKKLSNNKYKVTVELGYDVLGHRQRKTKIVNGSIALVKQVEAEMTNMYYHKSNIADIKDYTFQQYSEVFINKYCKENVSLITLKGYEHMLSKINPLIGRIKLNKITSYILDNLYNKLRYANKKVLSSETMLHYYRLINVMFNQAIKWDLINENPNEKATKFKKEKKERNFYDLEQISKLQECLKNESIKYQALIKFAIDSGARRGEICALKWEDIDFETNSIIIDNSLKVVKGIVDEEKAKTIYSERKIYVCDETIELLKEYKKWQDEYILKMGSSWKGSNRVFTSSNGEHMHPDTCSKIITKLVKKYNLPKLTFHELRHTSASVMVENGINLKAVSQRLGHSNTNITDIYTHTFDETKIKCANIFNEIIKNN